jgi:hypothetical protein
MTKKEIIDHAMMIEGMMSEWDLDLLYDHAMAHIPKKGLAYEIGGWKGRSTYVLGSVCAEKGATLYEFDTFKGVEDPNSRKNQPGNLNGYYEAIIDPKFVDILSTNVAGLPVIIIPGDSKITLPAQNDRYFDYCFIDGNHDSPFVDEDIKNSLRKIKIGGFLSGHDHGNPDTDVAEVVTRMFGSDITVGEIRPVEGDPKYSLTIWWHIVKGNEI